MEFGTNAARPKVFFFGFKASEKALADQDDRAKKGREAKLKIDRTFKKRNAMAKKAVRLSGNGYLYVIERFAIRLAKSIVGGEITGPNNPYGDLYHKESGAFSEVKAAGLSRGPIIERDQLERHFADLEKHDHWYIFVLYDSRKWNKGKWVYLPRRVGRTENALQNFLKLNVKEVWSVHISVIEAIFRFRKRDIRCYNMQRGPKTYLIIYPGFLKKLVRESRLLADLGLEPNDYLVETRQEFVRFQGKAIRIEVSAIKPKSFSEESFQFPEAEPEFVSST